MKTYFLLLVLISSFGISAHSALRSLPLTSKKVEVTGTTKNYNNVRKDSYADFGLVLKGLSKSDLLNIRLSNLLSPSLDTLDLIFGKTLDIPSNIAFPEQSERYSFFTIRLNKPTYRHYFKPGENTSMIALRGRFPFADVIDGFRNNASLLDLISYFEIQSYTFHSGPTYTGGGKVPLDISMEQSLLRETQAVSAPQNIPSSYNFITTSLIKKEINGQSLFFPTDLKVSTAGKTSHLKIERGENAYLSALFHSSFADPDSNDLNKFRKTLNVNTDPQEASVFLGFIKNLNYSNGLLSFAQPKLMSASSSNIHELGLSLRVYQTHTSSGQKLKEEILTYDDFQTGAWPTSISLNGFEAIRVPSVRYRLELSIHASRQNTTVNDQNSMNSATELVTQNAISI